MSNKSPAVKFLDRVAIGLTMLLFVSCAVIAYRQHQLEEIEAVIDQLEAAALNLGESLEKMIEKQEKTND